ncbi:flagellin [Escherichia coli]
MLSINTNNASMAAVNAISKSSSSLSTSMERLATGNRINSSADDAAGKQIANRLTAQSSGMGVALSNINDATAMLQTADSMFDEMSDVLGRMKDLSTQAANGTYSDDDLQAMQDEYDELGQQMSDMLQNTTYGGTNLFGVSGTNLFGVSGTSNTGTDGLFQSAVTFQVGAESSDTMTVNISSQLNTLVTDLSAISNSFSADQADTTGTAGVSGGTELTASGSANQMITSISTAMDDVSQIQSKLGASINRLNDTANNLTSMQDNTEVAIGNIMDTDYATEASNMTKQQVLMQTGITMLKQSNSMSSMVSSLLQ